MGNVLYVEQRVPVDDIPEGWGLREMEMEGMFESVGQILRGDM